MPRTKGPASFGFVLISLFLTAAVTSRHALHAQTQAPAAASAAGQDAYLCTFQGQKETHQIVYVSPIIRAAARNPLNLAFVNFIHATYDFSKIRYPHGSCDRVFNDAAGQANTMSMMEKQWAASKTEVIHVNWTNSAAESPAAAAATTAAAAPSAPPSSAQSATFFMSCSTSGGAGIDTYYTGISDVGAKPGSPPRGPYAVGANVGGTWMIPAVTSQSVLDHFQAYLTQKGYNFKPGSSSGCDVTLTEAATKAAQHKRAYEGGGCSSCGKVVETGWKYTP